MKRINVAVVGCGFIGETAHIPNLLKIPEARLIAICDIDHNKLRRIGERYGIKNCYDNFEDIIKISELDAVIISTPTATHAQLAIKAAEAGKHIFVEKPLATSFSEAEAVVRTAEKHDVKLMVGYQMRFLPNHVKTKEIIKKGEIGEIFYAEAHSETLIVKPEEGILLDYGSHFVDLLRWYFDNTHIESVAAILHTSDKNIKAETEATLILRFLNGVTGRIGVFWLAKYSSWEATDRYVKFIGTKGKIVTEQSGPMITLYKEGSLLNKLRGPYKFVPRFAINPNIPLSEIGYRRELEHFIKCVANDKEPRTNGRNDLINLKTIEAAKESFRNQKFMKVI